MWKCFKKTNENTGDIESYASLRGRIDKSFERDNKKIIISGEYGSGKSTWIKKTFNSDIKSCLKYKTIDATNFEMFSSKTIALGTWKQLSRIIEFLSSNIFTPKFLTLFITILSFIVPILLTLNDEINELTYDALLWLISIYVCTFLTLLILTFLIETCNRRRILIFDNMDRINFEKSKLVMKLLSYRTKSKVIYIIDFKNLEHKHADYQYMEKYSDDIVSITSESNALLYEYVFKSMGDISFANSYPLYSKTARVNNFTTFTKMVIGPNLRVLKNVFKEFKDKLTFLEKSELDELLYLKILLLKYANNSLYQELESNDNFFLSGKQGDIIAGRMSTSFFITDKASPKVEKQKCYETDRSIFVCLAKKYGFNEKNLNDLYSLKLSIDHVDKVSLSHNNKHLYFSDTLAFEYVSNEIEINKITKSDDLYMLYKRIITGKANIYGQLFIDKTLMEITDSQAEMEKFQWIFRWMPFMSSSDSFVKTALNEANSMGDNALKMIIKFAIGYSIFTMNGSYSYKLNSDKIPKIDQVMREKILENQKTNNVNLYGTDLNQFTSLPKFNNVKDAVLNEIFKVIIKSEHKGLNTIHHIVSILNALPSNDFKFEKKWIYHQSFNSNSNPEVQKVYDGTLGLAIYTMFNEENKAKFLELFKDDDFVANLITKHTDFTKYKLANMLSKNEITNKKQEENTKIESKKAIKKH